jgi:predicted  nucleic acid-binding Zn-ribbon protein
MAIELTGYEDVKSMCMEIIRAEIANFEKDIIRTESLAERMEETNKNLKEVVNKIQTLIGVHENKIDMMASNAADLKKQQILDRTHLDDELKDLAKRISESELRAEVKLDKSIEKISDKIDNISDKIESNSKARWVGLGIAITLGVFLGQAGGFSTLFKIFGG